MKKLFLTLTVILLSVSFYPVKAMEKTADTLKRNVVTSGDGLYVDTTADGRYIYKGANPNNYIKLGDDLYRIIALEKDGTIKVIKQESIGKMRFDDADYYGESRRTYDENDYCGLVPSSVVDPGCNVWGNNMTILDSSGNHVTQMPKEIGGQLKNLPDKEATLNIYLNNDFYNSLSDNVKNLIVEGIWNIGPLSSDQINLLESIKEDSAYKWKGKVALMSAIDYVKSSTNNECTGLNAYFNNSKCYNNSSSYNYLVFNAETQFKFLWTISNGIKIGDFGTTGGLGGSGGTVDWEIHPAFFLSSETTLNGEGSETDPYKVSKYVEEVKEEPKEENNNNNEVKVDNGQIVEVPSTSAFGSIIIAGLGLACVGGSAVIMRKTAVKNNKYSK